VPRAAEIFPVFLRFVLPFIVIIKSDSAKESLISPCHFRSQNWGPFLTLASAPEMSPVFGLEFGHEIGAPANKFTIAKIFSQSELGSKLESKLGFISDSGFSAVNYSISGQKMTYLKFCGQLTHTCHFD